MLAQLHPLFKCSSPQLLGVLLMVHVADSLRPFVTDILRAEPSRGSALRFGLVRGGRDEGDGQAAPQPEDQAKAVAIEFLKCNVSEL